MDSIETVQKTFLHVGCGPARKEQAGPGFRGEEWQELRLDIDPSVQPDIVGTMTDMSAVADESVDAVYSSHNIEHLYPHEVPLALAEFRRVLKDDGFVVLTCPDLQSVAALVAEDKLTEPAYVSQRAPSHPWTFFMAYAVRWRPAISTWPIAADSPCGS